MYLYIILYHTESKGTFNEKLTLTTKPLKLDSVPLLNMCLTIRLEKKKKRFLQTYAAPVKQFLNRSILFAGNSSPYTSKPQFSMTAP